MKTPANLTHTDRLFGYPVHLNVEIGGKTYRVKDAICWDDEHRYRVDVFKVADAIAAQTAPCPHCGTRPGGTRCP